MARARRALAHVSAVDARLPLAFAPAQGGAPEPALGRCQLRDARGVLQVGARPVALRSLPVPTDRGLDPDLSVCDALRTVHGLRGVPRHAHARDLGRGARQRAGGLLRARADGADHHRGGDRDGGGVQRLHCRLRRRAAAVRSRPRGRDLRGRDHRASTARSGADGRLRSLELVAA